MADQTVDQLPEETAPSTDDELVLWDEASGTTKKVTLANVFALMRDTEWWEELGRTTLGSAGDTITVNNIGARRYLKVLIRLIPTGGTINALMRFNNDSGNSYAIQVSTDFGASADSVNASSLGIVTSAVSEHKFAIVEIVNDQADEKFVISRAIERGASSDGAGNAPDCRFLFGKWDNVAAQITRIDVVNGGTGDYNTNSEVVVLGHD